MKSFTNYRTNLKYTTALVTATFLAACNVAPRPMPLTQETSARAAAQEFTAALRAGDAQALRHASFVDPDPATHKLAVAVIGDTVSGRNVQLQLARRFADAHRKPTTVGSDPWVAQFEDAAANGTIVQAGDRARVGEPGADGTLYLRRIFGIDGIGSAWKVELVSTLVPESGGRPTVNQDDQTLVEYRFGVTRAINEWMLGRLQQDEFTSAADYEHARNEFWTKYLVYTANGDDPHDKLVAWLPPLPKDPQITSER